MPVRDDFSAGGVAVTPDGQVVVIVTSNTQGEPVVGLPKGHPEGHETTLETALREVREETGFDVAVRDESRNREIEYWFQSDSGDVVHKRVRFYRMRVTGGDPSHHDDEIEEVRLLPIDQAIESLTYATEQAIVRALCG